MGNLYGYKKWYEEDLGNGKLKKFRVKRKFENGKYVVQLHNEEYVEDNYVFIDKLIKYKKENNICKKLKNKFHVGNILFKLKLNGKGKKSYNNLLKSDDVIFNVKIYKQTEKLRENKKISKNDIAREISKKNLENLVKNITVKDYEIKIYDKDEDLDVKKEGEYAIKYEKMNECEFEIRKKSYDQLRSINGNLYTIISKACENEKFEKRYYLESLKNEILKNGREKIGEKGKKTFFDSIRTSIEEIGREFSKDEELNLEGFINFYSNINANKVSDNKKIFVSKILNYIKSEVELSDEDIVDYIIGELKYWDIIKRVEKLKENREETLIKTYIKYDKHIKFKEEKDKKDKIVKQFIDDIQNEEMKQNIGTILGEFEIEELKKKLKEKLESEIKKENIDTTLFGIYKTHYKEVVSKKYEEKVKLSESEKVKLSKKELYKIIYRYIKGRIEKILINRKNKNLISKIDEWFDEKTLIEKIKKRVKQYTLEYIMYLGKIKHNNIENKDINTETFQKLHAREELDLELITFFSATNMELNNIFKGKEKTTDFFGSNLDGQLIELQKKVPNFKLNILKKLDFINNEKNVDKNLSKFYNFQKKAYSLRNKILHSSSKNIQLTYDFRNEYNNVESLIKELKVSDDEISKTLNLDVIFEGKSTIIENINSLKLKEHEDKKYLPSFSKVIPEIIKKFNEINKDKNFDNESEKIIMNAMKYVNKVLYEKIISNSENEFIKNLLTKLTKSENILSIKEYYKNAQVLSSKGDKRAIKKYQNKIIDAYIEYLEKNFLEVIDFSKFNLNFEQIKNKIESRKNSRSKIILNSISTKIQITNDIEYILSIFALLNSNVYINKIRNRFFATEVWLNIKEYENTVNILDEIISINLLKENDTTDILDLNNSIIEAKIEENDEIYVKTFVFEKNKKEVIKELSKEFKEEKNLLEIFKNKDFNFEDFIKKNENGKFRVNFDSYDSASRGIIGKNIRKIELFIEKIIDNYKSKRKVKFSSEYLEKYKNTIDNLIKNGDKFKKIYYPEKNKNELYIYKKNLFVNIGNPSFDRIYELISENIQNTNTKNLFDENIKNKISETNSVLENLNDKLKSYSKEYKNIYIEKLKNDDGFFSKIVKKYNSYEQFKKDYMEVSEYRKIRDLVEFNYLNKIESYLIDINWKLAIQMARFERDIHYIVRGLEWLGIIKLNGHNDKSRAYPKPDGSSDFYETTAYYKFWDRNTYDKFESICGKFGIDLGANSEVQKKEEKSIRNYVSHFYIVRDPFTGYSLAEQINKVSKLMEYSTRYNNSTYMSVFEVFKKDVDLKYDELKKKIRLKDKESEFEGNDEEFMEISDLIEPKKVSVLELEHYNSEFIIELIEKILTKR